MDSVLALNKLVPRFELAAELSVSESENASSRRRSLRSVRRLSSIGYGLARVRLFLNLLSEAGNGKR